MRYTPRLVFEMEKVKLQIYLDAETYIPIHNYAMNKGFHNYSQALDVIIKEWQRFKAIAMKLQSEVKLNKELPIKRTETERIIDKVHGKGTKLDKNKNK